MFVKAVMKNWPNIYIVFINKPAQVMKTWTSVLRAVTDVRWVRASPLSKVSITCIS